MIEVHELHYTKAELARAPEPDRLFYLMATGLANDVQTLVKLMAAAAGEKNDDLIVQQGSSTVGMLMLRLVAGRLWEGGKLLKSNYEPIEHLYVEHLGQEAREALKSMRDYFADRQNLVAMVRDKIGFHAEAKIVQRAFNRMPDDTDLGDYLSLTMGNTLYYSAELIHYEAINGFAGGKDQPASLRALWKDVNELVGWFNTFIFGFAAVFLRRHLAGKLDETRDRKSQIVGVRGLDDMELTFFTELPSRAVWEQSDPGNSNSSVGIRNLTS